MKGNDQIYIRIITGFFCCAGLAFVFIFQKTNLAALWEIGTTPVGEFIFNRTIRFFLNDIFAIGLIYALFAERKYIIFSVWVQLTGVVIFLIPYFIFKVNFPEYNGPLINYLHRLILNPTLLLLLMPAFYYQKHFISPLQRPPRKLPGSEAGHSIKDK